MRGSPGHHPSPTGFWDDLFARSHPSSFAAVLFFFYRVWKIRRDIAALETLGDTVQSPVVPVLFRLHSLVALLCLRLEIQQECHVRNTGYPFLGVTFGSPWNHYPSSPQPRIPDQREGVREKAKDTTLLRFQRLGPVLCRYHAKLGRARQRRLAQSEKSDLIVSDGPFDWKGDAGPSRIACLFQSRGQCSSLSASTSSFLPFFFASSSTTSTACRNTGDIYPNKVNESLFLKSLALLLPGLAPHLFRQAEPWAILCKTSSERGMEQHLETSRLDDLKKPNAN